MNTVCTEPSHFKCCHQGHGRGNVTLARSVGLNLGVLTHKEVREILALSSSGGRIIQYFTLVKIQIQQCKNTEKSNLSTRTKVLSAKVSKVKVLQ